MSNPVNAVYTSFGHGDVTSTCSSLPELWPSVALETKSSNKVVVAQESKSWKSKKSQRQAPRAALEELENDESEDETGTCAPTPSPHIVIPTLTTGNLNSVPSNLAL